MNAVRTTLSRDLESLEEFRSILEPISASGSPVVYTPLAVPASRPPTVVLTLSFSIGPAGFRAQFPLGQLKAVLAALYKAGVKKIIYIVDSYDPRYDLAGKNLLTDDQLNLLEEICDEEFVDCDRNVSIGVGSWLYPYEEYDPFYTVLNEQVLHQLCAAQDEKSFLRLINGRYNYHWLNVRTNEHTELHDIVVTLKGKL